MREDAIMAILSVWLMAGLMIDGWAHTTHGGVESFFTPWHAAFYSGFLAAAGWMVYLARKPRLGFPRGGVPTGYRLGLTGLAIFGVGGVLDLIWHAIFGVEANIDALVSPTHMVLLVGAMLIISSPTRSGWHRPTARSAPWAWVAPAVVGVALCALLAQFFVLYGSGWQEPAFRFPWIPDGEDFGVGFSILGLLASTSIFVVAMMLLLRRWAPPFGSFAVVLGTIGLGMQGVGGFERPGELVGAIVAGLLLDALNLRWRPSLDAPTTFRLFALVAPIIVWSVHTAYLAMTDQLRWPPVLWGSIFLSGLLGLGLSTLAAPPALPDAKVVDQ